MGAHRASNCTLLTWLLLLSWLNSLAVSLLLAPNQSCLPSCTCSWRGGKFVADCSSQNLNQVPKNDHHEYLIASAGNNQMPTLTRDIQLLNLTANNIISLRRAEFYRKKFRNLQKIHLASNKLLRIDPNAFFKLTGLVELDLSENLLAQLEGEQLEESYSTSGLFSEDFDDIQELSLNITTSAGLTRLGFLHDLLQLRLLNLASNQLTHLSALAFVSQTQLRQLILSRNKIRSIDKRAFVGLEMLNVLHLDGNEISHLDGSMLLEMGKLHALRLAGPSWSCDCRLRKLVRLLGAHKKQQGVVNVAKLTTTNVPILEDEPECDPGGKAWSSMTLAQFECPPRVALQFMPSPLSPWQPHEADARVEPKPAVMNMNDDSDNTSNQDDDDYHNGVTPDQDNGDPARQAESRSASSARNVSLSTGANQGAHGTIKTQRLALAEQRKTAEQPVGLTCAIELTDELDLDLMQLDWWQLDEPAQRRLIWRSSSGLNPCRRPRQTKAEFTVIDYVTRANRTARTIDDANSASQSKEVHDGQEGGKGADESRRQLQPIRVVHLILAPSLGRAASTKRQYVCRVTNQSGRLELLHQLDLVQASSRAPASVQPLKLASGNRQQVEARLRRQPSSDELHAARSALRAAVQAETSGHAPTWPAFQPLCLVGLHSSGEQELRETDDQQVGVPGGVTQHTSAHQTTMNAKTSVRIVHLATGGSNSSSEPLTEQGSNYLADTQAAQERAELAVHLVVSYMSNRKALIQQLHQELADDEPDASGASDQLAGPSLGSESSLLDRFAGFRALYLDKWVKLVRSSDVPILLAALLGIALGSFLTVLVIVRFRCSRRARVVGDLYASNERTTAPSDTSAESAATGSDRKLIADSSCSPPSSNSDILVQRLSLQAPGTKTACMSDNLWPADSSTCQSADDEAEEAQPEEEAQESQPRAQVGRRPHQAAHMISRRQSPGTAYCRKELLIGAPRRPEHIIRAQSGVANSASLFQTRERSHMQMRHPDDYQRTSRNQSCSHIHLDPANLELDMAFINKVSSQQHYQQVAGTSGQSSWMTLPAGGSISTTFSRDLQQSGAPYLLSPDQVGQLVFPPSPELGSFQTLTRANQVATGSQGSSMKMSSCAGVETNQPVKLQWLPLPPSGLIDISPAAFYSPPAGHDGAALVAARSASGSSFEPSSPSLTTNSQLQLVPEQTFCSNQENFGQLNDAIKLLDSSMRSCLVVNEEPSCFNVSQPLRNDCDKN